MTDSERIARALEALRLSVDRLPHAIARALRRQRLAADGGEWPAAFAAAVNAELGDADWTARELLDHIRGDERAREAILRPFNGVAPSAQSLGSRLARVEGIECGDLRIERAGTPREIVRWRVVRLQGRAKTRKARS